MAGLIKVTKVDVTNKCQIVFPQAGTKDWICTADDVRFRRALPQLRDRTPMLGVGFRVMKSWRAVYFFRGMLETLQMSSPLCLWKFYLLFP